MLINEDVGNFTSIYIYICIYIHDYIYIYIYTGGIIRKVYTNVFHGRIIHLLFHGQAVCGMGQKWKKVYSIIIYFILQNESLKLILNYKIHENFTIFLKWFIQTTKEIQLNFKIQIIKKLI